MSTIYTEFEMRWPKRQKTRPDPNFLRDIAHFSEAELDSSQAGEEDAKALAEIVEYLRVGVQLVFEEWQPPATKH